MSGKSTSVIASAYEDLYVSTYLKEGALNDKGEPYTEAELREKVRNQLAPGGTGVNSSYTDQLYDRYVSSNSTNTIVEGQYNSGSENDIVNALSGNSGGIYAALKFNGVITENGEKYDVTGSHSVVIVDYDSGTRKFTYYDPQQNASGTFDWEDLNSVTGRN